MRSGSIGASILLIAVGAVMAYAVTVDTEGFNINTAGVILMVVGAIGLVVSLISMFVTNDRVDTHTETRYVERDRLV
jgi:Co/Zn/Cd efflux system component